MHYNNNTARISSYRVEYNANISKRRSVFPAGLNIYSKVLYHCSIFFVPCIQLFPHNGVQMRGDRNFFHKIDQLNKSVILLTLILSHRRKALNKSETH